MASNSLNMYYQNTRGLRTKTHMFKRNLQLSSYDIISLTETWLLNGIDDSELFDDRYIVFRRDRNYIATNERYGGGVLLAIHRQISAVVRSEWSSSAEDIWVTITVKTKCKTSAKIHLCTVYLCDENLGYAYNSQVCNFTDKLSRIINSCPNDLFVIMGDFNFSNIIWACNCYVTPQYSNVVGEAQTYFFDTLSECDLTQYNFCRNINNRILDLVLCNTALQIVSSDYPLVPEDVHHKSLEITLNIVT